MQKINGVRVYAWNPRQGLSSSRVLRRVKIGARKNNFGDLIGPVLIDQILRSREGLKKANGSLAGICASPKLISVGSVMHFARPGDVIWGTGVNGKVSPKVKNLRELDVRSVRGPLTASYLKNHGLSLDVPFGDPGILLPEVFPQIKSWTVNKTRSVLGVPNLNDMTAWRHSASFEVLDPTSEFWGCIRAIAQAEMVVASSLHALIIADSLGIPTIPVASPHEPIFKYRDYYEGAGMQMPIFADDLNTIQRVAPKASGPSTHGSRLLEVFPWDLWE